MEQTLGKRIVKNRKRLGLTQEQLAERLGVTPQAISKWENDQSCPDITLLPKLAEVFGTTTDELLGHKNTKSTSEQVHQAEVVEDCENEGIHLQNGNWEIRWDNSRRSAIGFAVFVLAVGVLYMLTQIYHWSISLWDIIWTTGILMIGICELVRKFSFFSMGCILFGGYSLVTRITPLPPIINGQGIWAIVIVIFGLSLLADAFKKPKKSGFHVVKPKIFNGKTNKAPDGNKTNRYSCSGDSFTYNSTFAGDDPHIDMAFLRRGEINVSFGSCTVDLSDVETVADDCEIIVNCSFGEVEILVPSKYRAVITSDASFGHVDLEGDHDDVTIGNINISGNVSFGEISIQYV